MSRYSNHSTLVENHVVTRHYETKFWADYYRIKNGSCCNPGFTWTGISSYDKNDDLSSLAYSGLPTVHLSSRPSAQAIDDLIAITQTEAYASHLNGFDLLTELAEGRETVRSVVDGVKAAAGSISGVATKDTRSWKRFRNLTPRKLLRHADKAARALGSRWLYLRYALLPIIYSFRDIAEVARDSKFTFDTDRSYRSISVNGVQTGEIPEVTCLVESWDGIVRVNSTVKSAYHEGVLQRVLAHVPFNPFRTAWELIPLSFVVDWFINAGDVITSQTALDLSSQRAACTSVKEELIRRVYLKDSSSDVSVRNWSPGNVCRPPYQENHTYQRDNFDVLQTTTIENYTRTLWSRPEPTISFDPFVDWKRWLDSVALANRPTQRLLRRLLT